ncbi:tRNA1Val (adenine37-N6)-methyltransferase [Sinobacterium caligoides]|uniref:tRNA1(Val) (adenine(37)-N6)-methyltransferase n=1 Tax=Sinobacterium caligoides TaxID=933926 RepID=A0A3N2E0Z5_9GAMM|nr:methyltransferase [Sinobacterium caligoides]ROS05764.1 tRNA1Val (adenine37-N6)-methyltransferase [Sinobacterium caligoides]
MSLFQLQQFSLQQDHAAMKVCGDSLLFGASLPIRGGESIIDIGAGTGILSLMALQQGAATATAVEIDEATANECQENFLRSPWHGRLQCVCDDIQTYRSDRRFDLVISNPPFFANQQRSTQASRRTARHTDSLPFAQLISAADRLLHKQGLLCLLIPHYEIDTIVALCGQHGLQLQRQISIQGRAELPAKVAILWFQRRATAAEKQTIIMYQRGAEYSGQSRQLLQDYLLRFAQQPNNG